MTFYQQTVRLDSSQYRTLNVLAERRGLTSYRMLGKIIDAGFLAVMHGTDKETDIAQIAGEVGSM